MNRIFSWLLLANICLLPVITSAAFAEAPQPIERSFELWTPEVVEIDQALNFKSLDMHYIHYKNLPLALKLLGLPYGADGQRLIEEVNSRLKKYRATTDKPDAMAEARAILNASPTESDQVVKSRIKVIDLVIQTDGTEQTLHPGGEKTVFLLCPHQG